MKNKKIMIILIVVIIVLVFAFSLFMVIDSLNKSAQEEKKNADNVVKYYTKFKENADNFVNVRDKYYEVVVDDLYIESVNDDYSKWVVELDNYKELVDSVIDSAKPLKNLCVNKSYGDEDVNNKCVAYIKNYETIANCFIDDINIYNEFIKDYLKTNSNSKAKSYELDTKVYNYIDLDGDKIFTGKK